MWPDLSAVISAVGARQCVVLLVSLLCWLTSGCALVKVEQSSSHQREGVPFDAEVVDTLVPGKTLRRDVLDAIGPPDQTRYEGDHLIYTYLIDRDRKRRVKIFMLLQHHSQSTIQRQLEIHFDNDIVTVGKYVTASYYDELPQQPAVYP